MQKKSYRDDFLLCSPVITTYGSLQVYLDAPLIINGLCVRWKGYINLEKLDGVGGFRFDEDSARVISNTPKLFSTFYSLFVMQCR